MDARLRPAPGPPTVSLPPLVPGAPLPGAPIPGTPPRPGTGEQPPVPPRHGTTGDPVTLPPRRGGTGEQAAVPPRRGAPGEVTLPPRRGGTGEQATVAPPRGMTGDHPLLEPPPPPRHATGEQPVVVDRPGSRTAELRRQAGRAPVLALAVAALVLFVALPAVFLLRDASADPVFADLDNLRLPSWAAQAHEDSATGNRWCVQTCRLRERTWRSAKPAQATDPVYRQALSDAGWRLTQTGSCPAPPPASTPAGSATSTCSTCGPATPPATWATWRPHRAGPAGRPTRAPGSRRRKRPGRRPPARVRWSR